MGLSRTVSNIVKTSRDLHRFTENPLQFHLIHNGFLVFTYVFEDSD